MSTNPEQPSFWARQEPAVKAALIALVGSLIVNVFGGVWKVYTYENEKTVTAAQRQESCESRHGMKAGAAITNITVPTSQVPFSQPYQSSSGTLYRYCLWPPVQGADADGYLQITSYFVPGPGQDEASGDNFIEEIYSPCRKVVVTYEYAHMGAESFLTFTAKPRTYVSALTTRRWNAEGSQGLSFYVDDNEVAIVQNDDYSLTQVRCG
jgi:hypothetical protein